VRTMYDLTQRVTANGGAAIITGKWNYLPGGIRREVMPQLKRVKIPGGCPSTISSKNRLVAADMPTSPWPCRVITRMIFLPTNAIGTPPIKSMSANRPRMAPRAILGENPEGQSPEQATGLRVLIVTL
jgi:hypothetical protein